MRRRRPAAVPGPDAAALVRQLGALLGELGLSEIEVSHGDLRVRLQRSPVVHGAIPVPAAPAAAPAPAESLAPGTVTIEAPMVGTFYRAASPAGEPYVREGDVVKEGHIVGIIEAMKLMNEIESRAAGRVVEVLVENGQAVEYGQPLFVLEPLR
ncbi:MAG: acetyl-CoA carboxylase biotin carboxyl carrier protein [Candidatus Rokubacteria bacterium]|nr:acetyl-CoA carboxylase biotin carboxyl carrier protein [Candidatus Rokubacteria bacterium]MBI3825542.1 acetyl-CoA carboxylase biotin carboxyl carrier protein [Candidatus Rokubacteria bacterium]